MRTMLIGVLLGFLGILGVLLGVALISETGLSSHVGSCGAVQSASGEPPLIDYYLGAARRYGLGADGYAYLGAINHVETGFGTDLASSSAGAVGWMQFEPATFARYGVSVTDPAAAADPADPQDAIDTAARYLAASGAPGDWDAALYAYDHSAAYVAEVGGYAAGYLGPDGLEHLSADIATYWHSAAPAPGDPGSAATDAEDGSCDRGLNPDVTPVRARATVIMPDGLARPSDGAPAAVQAMVAAGDRLIAERYSWGGGHCVGAMDQQQADPSACVGEQEYGGPGYDCSSATMYVLWGGGRGDVFDDDPAGTDSGTLMDDGLAGAGRYVTWMASAGHVYIDVDGAVLNTENGEYFHAAPQPPLVPSASGPRWLALGTNPDDSLGRAGFVPRHPLGL